MMLARWKQFNQNALPTAPRRASTSSSTVSPGHSTGFFSFLFTVNSQPNPGRSTVPVTQGGSMSHVTLSAAEAKNLCLKSLLNYQSELNDRKSQYKGLFGFLGYSQKQKSNAVAALIAGLEKPQDFQAFTQIQRGALTQGNLGKIVRQCRQLLPQEMGRLFDLQPVMQRCPSKSSR